MLVITMMRVKAAVRRGLLHAPALKFAVKRYLRLILIIGFASPHFNNCCSERLPCADISSEEEERRNVCQSQ